MDGTISRIIFEDNFIIVCYKPPGLAVQSAGLGTMDMESLLRRHLVEAEASGRTADRSKGMPYLGIVHRLDQPVEGLLVFAKTPEAAASLSRQVQGKGMEKEYLALVQPVKEGRALLDRMKGDEERRLEDFLVKDGRTHMSRIAQAGEKGARKAVLLFSIREKMGDNALLHVRLVTGRHHQIRVQLSHAGLPIAGDRKYGVEEQGHPDAAGLKKPDPLNKPGLTRRSFPALCAYRLSFAHPKTGKQMVFELESSGIAFYGEKLIDSL